MSAHIGKVGVFVALSAAMPEGAGVAWMSLLLHLDASTYKWQAQTSAALGNSRRASRSRAARSMS